MAERKKRKPAKTRQPIKKNTQPAQEVQKDIKEITFNAIQAEYLMRRAAKRYDKPETEIFLIDALNMLYDDIKGDNMTDKEKKETTENAEKIEKAGETITGKKKENISLADLQAAIKEQMPPQNSILSNENIDVMTATIKAAASVGEAVAAFSSTITAIAQSIDFQATLEAARNVFSFAKIFIDHKEELAEITGRAQEFEKETLPFIMLEVAERTGYKDTLQLTFDDICKILENGTPAGEEQAAFFNEIEKALDQFSLTGEPETPQAKELLQAALNRKAEVIEGGQAVLTINNIATALDETTTDKEKAEIIAKSLPEIQDLPRIIAQQIDSVNYPLDKPNSKIWNLLTEIEPNGQIKINFDTSKKGSGKNAVISYSINFEALENMPELKITRKLTPFDKRIYIVAAALFNAGNEVITATQIYKADHDKEPSDTDIKKINESLTKMGAAHVFIDNNKEINVNTKYPKFYYDASLLPFERMSAYINGKLSEAAIHLLREPPLITFAKERKQITTIDREILLAPVSKTDANLRIEDYLIERISHMKSQHSKAPRRLLYSTIYENCSITEKKQKQRTPEKIKRFLNHYKDCGFIKGYSDDAEGVNIEI